MIEETVIRELLRLKGKNLYHREGQELEFKEQFNIAGLATYFRDFAAFSNNKGGFLIFGIKDSPRIPVGLSSKAENLFDNLDPATITGELLKIFSPKIIWEHEKFNLYEKSFGVIKVNEAATKPVIAKKDEGKDAAIKNGDIFFRYGGRTQKIQYAELENIINQRIEKSNQNWLNLMAKIGRVGPENALVLDTEKAVIEQDESRMLFLDKELANTLKFVKEGEFVESGGSPTLKLIGEVVPVDKVEVEKILKEDLFKLYPLSATEVAEAVLKRIPCAHKNLVWEIIRDNKIKENPDYSQYNFRTKQHREKYEKTGHVPNGTPSIYNEHAVEFIVNVLKGPDYQILLEHRKARFRITD